MGLLTRPQRQALVDLLMRLPNITDAASRNLLLTDLPSSLTQTIPFDGAAGIHVANIVNAVNSDAWARLPDGTVPLLLVIENAIYMVQGSGLAAQLQALHDAIQAAPAPPAPPAAPAAPSISLANLTGPQRKQLSDALLSAFPTAADLQQMVYFGLDANLNQITGAGNLSTQVLDLIVWAQAQSRMTDLVNAARAANAGNTLLKAFAQAAGLS
jgi:hypothetical protein